jgi:hypothetical protein
LDPIPVSNLADEVLQVPCKQEGQQAADLPISKTIFSLDFDKVMGWTIDTVL